MSTKSDNKKQTERKQYNQPKLTKFGSIVDLTAGTSGSDLDVDAGLSSNYTN